MLFFIYPPGLQTDLRFISVYTILTLQDKEKVPELKCAKSYFEITGISKKLYI
jgi:hypothetical protein